MSATVEELLELPVYRQHAKLCTSVGLSKEVKYFTVMETPDFHINTLGGQVFVLTTLSAHYESLEEINRVVEQLCQADVSAIGIKLGRFVDELDGSTIAIIEAAHIPLITFDSNGIFIKVICIDTKSIQNL